MARLPRIVIPDQPLHIMHRGNNRQDIFESEADMTRIKEDIAMSLTKSGCALHAYVIMTNHLHFLLTPSSRGALTVFMQSVANRYVRYFNADRKRSGTIWEGRFKSCLVDSDNYLFALYRYIEMNPVRAGMVMHPTDYRWSSYHHNAGGSVDKLVCEHGLYLALGRSDESRTVRYLALFDGLEAQLADKQIALATTRGEVLGSKQFHSRIAKQVSRPTQLGQHGGDRKSQHYLNQAG